MTQSDSKRKYESPSLGGVTAIEAGSALCCKSTPATCSNSSKGGQGKGRRTKDGS